MKVFKYSLILLFALTINVVNAQKNVIDEVIAVVGDNAVLKSDVEYQYQQAVMQGVTSDGDLKCSIFEQRLIQEMMISQAELDSIMVDENQVVSQVDNRVSEFINRAGGREKLEEWYNKSIIQIKKDQMGVVRDQMITQQMQQTITADIDPTPSQVRSYYRRTAQDSLPMVAAQYKVQKIAIYPKVDQEEIDEVKAKLRDFQKQVADGRDFSTLAVLYSEDPGSATNGGDLGWATRSTFVPEFANVAFNMQEKGKVSKIVETEFGYHIIQLVDRKGDRIHVRHILLKPKVSATAKESAKARIDSIKALIDEDKLSFEEAALRFSMDKDTRNNGGVMVNQYSQSSSFELSDIQEPTLAKELQKLSIGEVSNSFIMKDDKSKDVYIIIKESDMVEPHRANIEDDYQLIQSIMVSKLHQDSIEEWIKEKQNETYITINEEWQGCDFEYKNWIK